MRLAPSRALPRLLPHSIESAGRTNDHDDTRVIVPLAGRVVHPGDSDATETWSPAPSHITFNFLFSITYKCLRLFTCGLLTRGGDAVTRYNVESNHNVLEANVPTQESMDIYIRLHALRRERAAMDIEIRMLEGQLGLVVGGRPAWTCLRCGHIWRGYRTGIPPAHCARCHSPSWSQPPVGLNDRRPSDPPNPKWRKPTGRPIGRLPLKREIEIALRAANGTATAALPGPSQLPRLTLPTLPGTVPPLPPPIDAPARPLASHLARVISEPAPAEQSPSSIPQLSIEELPDEVSPAQSQPIESTVVDYSEVFNAERLVDEPADDPADFPDENIDEGPNAD